jgi:hypothetical protein
MIMNERNCIYKLIFKWIWIEKLGFSLKSAEKNNKKLFFYYPEAPRALVHFFALVRTPKANNITLRRAAAVLLCIFAFFLVFLSVFFLEIYLETCHRISPLCNVFRDLLNHNPLSSQILMRCFALPICMILH